MTVTDNSWFLTAPVDHHGEHRARLGEVRQRMHSTDADDIQQALATVIALRNETSGWLFSAQRDEEQAIRVREEAESMHRSVCQTLAAMLGVTA